MPEVGTMRSTLAIAGRYGTRTPAINRPRVRRPKIATTWRSRLPPWPAGAEPVRQHYWPRRQPLPEPQKPLAARLSQHCSRSRSQPGGPVVSTARFWGVARDPFLSLRMADVADGIAHIGSLLETGSAQSGRTLARSSTPRLGDIFAPQTLCYLVRAISSPAPDTNPTACARSCRRRICYRRT